MDLPVLKVDSVELDFNGRKILQGVQLNCRVGEIVGLLGRNGSGKSSLLKIIFGTLNPTHKYVSINNVFIKKGYHQNHIAYLPQHNYLPNGIPIHQLSRMLVDEKRWDEFTELPIYREHTNKNVGQLSGGEQRQLETLMIVYSRADFILLDEPFTHISPVQTEDFKAILRQTAKTKGVIITDHQYYNIIDVSHRLILLNDGYTKHISQPDELVTYGYLNGV